tara:strand:+ start:6364 stop:8388 length:2025 start_codon:yes stop_codon:yes gene_type:complete
MVPKNTNLFQRLTSLFRAGPIVRRKVKDYSGPGVSSALEIFRRQYSDVYNSTLSAYGSFDRMSRYSDFSEMEATPEIASALDIYAEETVSSDDKGQVLHIYAENRMIEELLHTLFYDTLNVEFNLAMWVRNLCKYGDFFLFNDVSPEFGVINVYPISISEIEREEGFDPNDPAAVRFRWITQGNQTLENWQVSHFRLLGNDAFLPYGSSVLEAARRIWRQLILIEDAMLVYRVIRAPERRVFYIDVGNVPPENVADYIEQAKNSLKRNQVVDKNNGKVDLRYNPMSVDEDYFLPVRGGESGTRIETLAGGQNTAAIEDVEYIQKKLFAALKIPRAYLGYDEEVGAKATLAQEDIRFSRTIQRIQKTVISELNKIAMIHLFAHGYEGEDLIDFELKLSNPSSIAQQQKLELISTRFDIAGKAPEGITDRRWIRKNVMGLTDREIDRIEEGKVADKEEDLALEAIPAPEAAGGEEGGGGEEAAGGEEGGLFAGDEKMGALLTALPGAENIKREADLDDDDDLDEIEKPSIDDEDAPAKAQKQIRNVFNEPIKKSRKVTRGPASTHMPDFKSMTSVGTPTRGQDTLNKPFDDDFIKSPFKESTLFSNTTPWDYIDDKITQHAKLTNEMESTLKKFRSTINIPRKGMILESSPALDDETIELQIDEKGNLIEDGKSSQ